MYLKFYVIYSSILNFLEERNISLFFYIFSFLERDQKILKISIFFCRNVIIIFPVFLFVNWILHKKERKIIIDTILISITSLLINSLIKKIWFVPRPFTSLIKESIISHAYNSSFPSNHASLSLSVSMNFIITKKFKYQGIFLFVIGNIISLSRIHTGLHFPLDILGSLIVSIQSILIDKFIKLKNRKLYKPIEKKF